MLILTRRKFEQIYIGQNKEVVIKFLGKSKNGGTKVGIEAAKEIPVYRAEIYEKYAQNGNKHEQD